NLHDSIRSWRRDRKPDRTDFRLWSLGFRPRVSGLLPGLKPKAQSLKPSLNSYRSCQRRDERVDVVVKTTDANRCQILGLARGAGRQVAHGIELRTIGVLRMRVRIHLVRN